MPHICIRYKSHIKEAGGPDFLIIIHNAFMLYFFKKISLITEDIRWINPS